MQTLGVASCMCNTSSSSLSLHLFRMGMKKHVLMWWQEQSSLNDIVWANTINLRVCVCVFVCVCVCACVRVCLCVRVIVRQKQCLCVFECCCLSVFVISLCVWRMYVHTTNTLKQEHTNNLSISWGWRRNAYWTAFIAVAWTCPGPFDCTSWFCRRCSWTNAEQDVLEPRSCTGTTFFWLGCSNLWGWFWRCTLCWLWQQLLVGWCLAVQKLSVCTRHLCFYCARSRCSKASSNGSLRMGNDSILGGLFVPYDDPTP